MKKLLSIFLFFLTWGAQRAMAQEYATETYLLRVKRMLIHDLSAILGIKPKGVARKSHEKKRAKSSAHGKPLRMPLEGSAVCFSSNNQADEHLGKEVLFKACRNWYLQVFPFAHQDMVIDDQVQGKILGRCSYSLKDPTDAEETIRVNFLVAIAVRYRKCQLKMYDIQLRYEGSWKNPKTGREEKLNDLYETYTNSTKSKLVLRSDLDPELKLINQYFSGRIESFKHNLADLTHFSLNNNF